MLGHSGAVGLGGAACADGDESAGIDDAIKGAAIHDKVFEDREGSGAPGLYPEFLAVSEVSHVELAGGGGALGTVGHAIDDHSAGSADALPAVVLKCDGVLARFDKFFINHVQHFQKRHVFVDVVGLIGLKASRLIGARLTPDV